MSAVICWFHQDLRLSDHPALTAAIAKGKPVIPVYIYDDISPGKWAQAGLAGGGWINHYALMRICVSFPADCYGRLC